MSEYLCQMCADDRASVTASADYGHAEGVLLLAQACSDCWELLETCIGHIMEGRYTMTGNQIVLGVGANPVTGKEGDE